MAAQLRMDNMEQDNEMKKKILQEIMQNASKLIGDKLQGKPAAMMIDIKSAHPMDDEDMPSLFPKADEEEDSPSEHMMEGVSHENPMDEECDDDDKEQSPLAMLLGGSDEKDDEDEPSDDLKRLIEVHLKNKGMTK